MLNIDQELRWNLTNTILSFLHSGTYGVEVEFPELPAHHSPEHEMDLVNSLHKKSGIPVVLSRDRSCGSKNFELWTPYGCWSRMGQYPLELSLAETDPLKQPELMNYIKLLLNVILNPSEETRFPFLSVGYYDGNVTELTLGYHENFSHPRINVNSFTEEQLLILGLGLVTAIVFCPIVPQVYGDNTTKRIVLVSSPKAGIVKRFFSEHTGNYNILRKIDHSYGCFECPDDQGCMTHELSRVGSLHMSIYSPDISPISHLLRLITVSASLAFAVHNNKHRVVHLFQNGIYFSHESTGNALWCEKPHESLDVLVGYFNDLAFSFPVYMFTGYRTKAVEIALSVIKEIAEHLSDNEPFFKLYRKCAQALENRDLRYLYMIDSAHTAYSYIISGSVCNPRLRVRTAGKNICQLEISSDDYAVTFTEYLNKTIYPFPLYLGFDSGNSRSKHFVSAYDNFYFWLKKVFPSMMDIRNFLEISRINPIEPLLQMLRNRSFQRALFIIENNTDNGDVEIGWDTANRRGERVIFK